MKPVPSILLVDDDAEMLKALTYALEKEGYRVVPKPDAISAIEHIESAKNGIDLVVTDVSMPGMKGTALLSALRTAHPEVPVILITAFGDWGQYAKTLPDGAYDYL